MSEKLRKFFRRLGPGFITGASDDDPSGIGTYSAAGAKFGLGQIWTPLYTLPLMIGIQEICARIGLVTGHGIAGVIRKNFSRRLLYFCVVLLLITNTVNIGADIGAMAAALNLLLPAVPLGILAVTFTVLIILAEILVPYKSYAKVLRVFAFSLLSYWVVAAFVQTNWLVVFKNLIIPDFQFKPEYIMILVGVLGTTISPYLFFWQASEEVEEEITAGRKTIKQRLGKNLAEVKEMRRDTIIGMVFSNLATFFIIFAAAETLFKNGITNIESASQAAQALRPFAGDFAYFFFTLGIIGTGLLGIPVLAGSAAYGLSEAFKLKASLGLKWSQAHGFYTIIAVSTLVGLLLNFIGINPMQALVYAAVLNGVIAVPLIFVIMKISNSHKVMGELKNGPVSNVLGWLTFAVMGLAAGVMIISFIF